MLHHHFALTDGEVEGGENRGQDNELIPQHTVIDLDYYTTVEELVDVGPEKLMEALGALGLKGGGTPQQLQKDFSRQSIRFQKAGEENGDAKSMHESENAKEISLTAVKVKNLGDILDETIERKKNVVNKHSLAYEEMEGEREEANAESENDDGDVQSYNPLNLPMGWDGKPRP